MWRNISYSITVLCVLVFVCTLINDSVALDCYSCKEITDVKQCKNTTTCGPLNSCFVERTPTGDAFNMGCLENAKCSNKVTLGGSGGFIGRRQISRCHECCSSDLCNVKLCDYSASTTCADDASIDCARLESLFGVCQQSEQAHDLCPQFCGLCKNESNMLPPTQSTATFSQTTHDPSILTTENSCQDQQPNCDRYDDAGCRGIFESWARAHCARRCGYCDGTTGPSINQQGSTTPSNGGVLIVSSTTYKLTGVKSPVKGTCYFQNSTFNLGEHWHDTCRYDCQCNDTDTNIAICTDICPHFNSLPPSCTIRHTPGECCPKLDCGNGTLIINHTTSDNVTANSTDCHDSMPGCEYYEDIVCTGIYEPWARAHCALRCGYCGYSSPCVDRLTYCDAYELRTACRDFPGWARYNCKQSCGLCT